MPFSFFSNAIVILVVVLILKNGALSSSSADGDHHALLAIKSKITTDPQGIFRSWNDSFPFCRWYGVTCGLRHHRVTTLNLTNTGLVGSLSPHIGNLSFLKYILIQNNQFYGSIPSEIGRLSRLQLLSLYNNSLTGDIPANISNCSKLWYINLATNMLSGIIPNIFNSLLRLTSLGLDYNNFTGRIPPSIGNLTSLEQLYLNSCPLRGSIPDSFHQLKNLRELSLEENGLVGAFPLFLFNLSKLEKLAVPVNKLYGSLPTNFCLSQPNLQILELGVYRFGGFLPPSISNCSKLEIFDIGENDFKGDIIIDFGKFQYLRVLGLLANNFESINGHDGIKFFDSLSNCSELESLELGEIQLRGVLPNSLGNFSSKLNYLGLHGNYISGSIPSSIGNLVGLNLLVLADNNFTGMIPESIGKLINLEEFYFEGNAFSGFIPRSLGNLSSVSKIALGGNKLEGTIPPTFGNCKRLIILDLYRNNLSGSIPKELFQLFSLSIRLDLSQNHLSGVLPQEIGNLKVLGIIDLSNNHFSGELPSSFSSCISLESLNLSGNFFHGSVPETFTTMRGLEYVDLSRNNLSGHIPKYLSQMHLRHLDLSYNNFEGEVSLKGVFANTSAVSIIGNHKLCGGIPELHLPDCITINPKGSNKLSQLVIIAISLSSTFACLALVCFFLFYCCKTNKGDRPSELILINSFEKISYRTLFKATEGFSSENLIGTGRFASVYRGVLDENGSNVAIKVLNLQRRGGFKSFLAECEALKNIRHRNLVKVVTSCSSIDFQGNDFKALVYDFMPNGNLESWLHSTHHMLNFFQRISIARDVACALDYLHCRCQNVVVHCDLKPSNILLDGDMVAHVGDFGLAKILSLEEVFNVSKSSSSFMRGTIGYAPPEYGLGNKVSTTGDVYSYGILLLELLTRKKPVDPMFEEGLSFHSYARTALADGHALRIVDPVLLNEEVNEKSLISLVKIAVQCSFESPQDRMDIGTVVQDLFSIMVTNSS